MMKLEVKDKVRVVDGGACVPYCDDLSRFLKSKFWLRGKLPNKNTVGEIYGIVVKDDLLGKMTYIHFVEQSSGQSFVMDESGLEKIK